MKNNLDRAFFSFFFFFPFLTFVLGMAIFFEFDKKSDTRYEWKKVWTNILDRVKYSGNQVLRFFNSVMGDGSKYIPPILGPIPD